MSHHYDFDPSELDEFLVEYVDGTMDPVVRQAFEEFLRVYPEVRAQVDCLASIRTELCRLGDACRCKAPPGFQDRLKRQLAGEVFRTQPLEHLTPQLNMIALAFSITILALAVGLSNVDPAEVAAERTVEEPPRTLVAEQTDPDQMFSRVDLEDSGAAPAESTLPAIHHMSTASSFATVFDRPVLLSVRRDFVAMKPAVMPLTK